ncbi:hypothetical protein AB205_0028450, partial [Aquarana catesbeiana]
MGWPVPPMTYILLGGQGLLLTFSLIASQNQTSPAPSAEPSTAPVPELRDPQGPLIFCEYLFFFGGQAYDDVEHTKVMCHALGDIECAGPRFFQRGNKPCI